MPGPDTPHSFSLAYVEALWDRYLHDPQSVSEAWRQYFESSGNGAALRAGDLTVPAYAAPAARGSTCDADAVIQERADQLVRNYRVRGHLRAHLDPLGRALPDVAELDPGFVGLTRDDLARTVSSRLVAGADDATLGNVIQRLEETYCRYIGAQFMHIDSLEIRQWLQQRMEGCANHVRLERDDQLRILTRLTDAVIFEQFLQARYVGAKTFSLEGAETLIPLLDHAIQHAAADGVEQIVMGMAHRGRLNVLYSIIGKDPRAIFGEFEDDNPQLKIGAGDVKYHLGHSGDYITPDGQTVHLSLCFNPSHLEFINPVAMGKVRAKQQRMGDADRTRAMTLLIHGDAAFAGEGVVQETLNLADLTDYTTGGTLHVIVNNQLGFTTPPREGRSTEYATDVARMLQIPIFHVNGENPEAVAQAVNLAMEFRAKFHRDVVIDMYCYRLHGHNEGDEPSFTQPLMYREIRARKSVSDGYLAHLLDLGQVTADEAEQIEADHRKQLEAALEEARQRGYLPEPQSGGGVWTDYHGGPRDKADVVDTAVDADALSSLMNRMATAPDGFNVNPKLKRGLERRREMAAGDRPLDWASAEALAFASLATEGTSIRLAGQDSRRGTFSQRHAAYHDVETGDVYLPFDHLSDDQASVQVINSPLSEIAVLGFEYGYSLDTPSALVLWEAQFGDFCNAAQVVIDQFIASAEDKWRRLSGIVMLLPHGFEGLGPEHSSARLERFLMLCAEDNIQVAQPTTPAQYFHLLRRQALRRWRKPLVVMTPKSLLRLGEATSPLVDLSEGAFQPVIGDDAVEKASHILLCTGKVYYDLLKQRHDASRDDVAIVRLEELYPFPFDALRAALAPAADDTPVVFVQEEPANMGAWRYIKVLFGDSIFDRLPLSCVSRAESASPATGSHAAHQLEQQRLIDKAFGGVAGAEARK